MRQVAIVAAMAAAGALVGVTVATLESLRHRAAVTFAVEVRGSLATPAERRAGALLAPTIASVAAGATVEENVARATRTPLSSVRAHLRARVVPSTSLVEVTFDDASAMNAARVAQQVAFVVPPVVSSRFGRGAHPVSVAVVEPAHAAAAPGRAFSRDGAVGAILGLAIGGAMTARRRHRTAIEASALAAAAETSTPAQRSSDRIARDEAIQAHIRTAAPRPLDRATRDAEIRDRVRASAPPPPPPPSPPPEPMAEPLPVPVVEPERPPVPGRPGAVSVDEHERRARAAGGARLEERLAFVAALRPQARAGVLGPQFDAVVDDVFGELL